MASLLRMSIRASVGALERSFVSSAATGILPGLQKDSGTLKPCRHGLQEDTPSWSVRCQATARYSKHAVGQALGQPVVQQDLKRARQRELESDSDSDSDSDTETRRKPQRKVKGNSEFWRRKMRTFHGLIDLNRDGVVSFDDFLILAERFVNLGHLNPRQQEEFQEALKVVWEDQWGLAHPYNMVTTEQYLENMHHVVNDRSLRSKAHEFLPHLFQAVDKDKKGYITVQEFIIFFECLGLGEQDAIESFKIVDINGDGVVSAEEFVKLGREYFLVEDEAHPSKVFWGPLISP
ncbi:sarcoplasmic calcium-binding protein [Anabrus simplex]|uniref:sarcoplasmic calcium-binding protein n=1 Tax=Anabrus simplex TaxID=316456 RepID=UPI0034DD9EBA